MSISDDCLESNSLYGLKSPLDEVDNVYVEMDGKVLKEHEGTCASKLQQTHQGIPLAII